MYIWIQSLYYQKHIKQKCIKYINLDINRIKKEKR